MLDPETPEDQREKLAGDVRGRIEGSGELRHGETWGVRKLAYEVRKRMEADYHLFRFRGESALLEDLDHSLKIAEGVLRFRVFSVDPRSSIVAPPPPVQPMRARREGRDGRPRRGEGRGRRDDRDDTEDRAADAQDEAAGSSPAGPPAEEAVTPSAPESSAGEETVEPSAEDSGDAPTADAEAEPGGEQPPQASS